MSEIGIIQPNQPSRDVDFHHPLFKKHANDWVTVSACVAGESVVKSYGTRFLPYPSDEGLKSDNFGGKEDEQTRLVDYKKEQRRKRRYQNYLARAAFLNATGRTLQGLLGMVMSEAVAVNLSGGLAILQDDADGRKVPMMQMLRTMLSENLQHGRGGLLVDFDGQVGDTAADKGRVMLRFFGACEIINWREVGQQTKLVVLKYVEDDDLGDDFRQQTRWYWLELRIRTDGRAYSRTWTGLNAAGGVIMTDDGTDANGFRQIMQKGTHATELPWVWLGALDNDSEPDAPPLADLANMNIHHFQSEADCAEIARLVGCPTLVVKGIDQQWADAYHKKGIFIGSTEGILAPENADVQIIQAEDRNLPLVMAERREKQMAKLGAKLVERGAGAKTATQAEDEAQTDNSILSLAVGNVQDCVNRALLIAGEYTNGSGDVTLPQKYNLDTLDSQGLTALFTGVQQGLIPMIDFIRYGQRKGIIDPTQTPEEVIDTIKNQEPIGLNSTLQSDADRMAAELAAAKGKTNDNSKPNNPQ